MNEFTMNIMRKLRGSTVPAASTTEGSPHAQLGLMHLKKLFVEYTNPAHPLSVAERDEKLYSMLPLFCKVFGSTPSNDLQHTSWDVHAFCQQVSLLMVAEIRKRASSQSTETASSAIAKFLEIESCEESSNGWMLLSTLNLLAGGGEVGLVQKMSELSVPSTLVKCLYLFFDLPEIPEHEADKKDVNSDFTPKERRILLQKIFVQLLVRLCSHRVPAEELARKDDLTLLFSTITSSCQPHNVMWRKSAAEVLMTLSRHGLTPPVVGYIHSKGCVAVCIKNMQGERELAPLELVEMFVTVFCFLKDSSEVSSILLEDFRQAQGYLFLSEFLLKLENDKSSEAQESIRNLVLMLTSLCMCGYIELKPSQASTGSLFQMQGFSLPQPSGRGTSVRNIQAFHVLQSTFLKSSSPLLCSTILDAISSIYHADNANYFILENQNTLSQFTERIHHKPPDVQQKLFELVLFLVHHLNFVPCKELISMSIFLKTHSMNQPECSVKCMQSLLEILRCHSLFKDVYREVGLLEVFVTCLNRYGNMLETRLHSHDYVFIIPTGQEQLGNLIIDGMISLLAANSDNTNVLRECGGAKSVHGLVAYPECRQKALGIVKELVLSSGGDEDMGQLLETLHSAPRNAYQLKTDILKTIAVCLKESHRSRTIFRKLNGFVNVISILVTLENALTVHPCSPDILFLIYHIFHTIGTAMRFEPANARHFQQEICQSTITTDNQTSATAASNNNNQHVNNVSSTLCDAVRLLGCFSGLDEGGGSVIAEVVDGDQAGCVELDKRVVMELVHGVWVDGIQHMRIPDDLPPIIAYATVIYRLLYDLALDLFDKPNIVNFISKSPNLSRQTSNEPPTQNVNNNSMSNKRLAVNSLNLVPPMPDPIIVHPGVVIAMLQLLPCLQSNHHNSITASHMSPQSPPSPSHAVPSPLPTATNQQQQQLCLQLYLADVIKSLVRTERNQQSMCDAGFVAHLLRIGAAPLQREKHPLHPPLQYMLERLAAQSLEPIDLRRFLRLGDPLNCIGLDEDPPAAAEASGGPVALTRIKTIVSMTTPRDGRAQSFSTMPPFVEFDMSAEGFGCLYLPSIAPQAINTGNVVTGVDTNVIGGIGTGDRMFPPQTGLSFSTWICVDKFSDPRTDPHCVRVLTLVRQLNNTRDEHLVCLSIILSARDKAIIISTQEKRFQDMNDRTQDDTTQPYTPSPTTSTHTARFLCPDILHEGHWHHLAIVLNRAVLKNSSLSLYVDGVDVHNRKLHYISQSPMGGGGSGAVGGVGGNSGVGSVYGFIGTPPVWRGWSRLCWKQGPCHLLEEVLTPSTVTHIYQLGPQYLGSLQAVILPNMTAPATSFTNALLSAAAASAQVQQQQGAGGIGSGVEPVQLVPEEKVVFGLNAKAVSPLTLSRIRKVYSRADSKSIAKQLGMSSHENATPIKILYNSAGHLAGAARTLGGVVIGYLGVRVFCPRPVATVVDTVGGCSLLLLVIARAQTIESLYAGVKALVCVVRTNRTAQMEMDRRRGYQTLAMLLKVKKLMLNSHILQIAFGLVGTVDSKRESGCIPNITAFQDLLCDLDIWHEAPGELLRTHLEHLYELAADTNEKRNNTWIMRDLQMVDKLLHITPSVKHPPTRHVLFLLLSALLGGGGGTGQVRQTDLLWFGQFIASTLPSSTTPSEKPIVLGDPNNPPSNDDREYEIDNILLRNRCLSLLHSLLFTNRNSMNIMLCDEISKTLGFDWILLFMQPHIHSSSVIISLRILVVLCSFPTLMNRFRDGLHSCAYLHNRNSMDTPHSLNQSLGASHHPHAHAHNTTTIDTSVTGTIVAAAAEVITSSTSSVVITASGVISGEKTSETIGEAGEGGAGGEVLYVPGFQHLGWLLEGHLEAPSAYYMVTALMMGQPGIKPLPKDETVYDLDSVWAFLWGGTLGGSGAPKVTLCADAVVVLLAMVRAILHADHNTLPSWLKHQPISIIQVLFQLYHNMPDFMPIFMSADVLGALASVLFSPSNKSESLDSSSGASTPAEDNHDSMVIVPDSTPHSTSALPLSGHPARQAIIDLIRAIIVDSLSLAVTSKTSPVIDIALDACPATATSSQQVAYQTELLVTLMDHLLAADMLVGDQAAIPIVPLASAHIQNVTPNVFYVTARIVDKLWQGCLTRDPHEVFDFIVKLIGQAKRRSTNLSLEGLYRSLNRCILYLLSRTTENIADQMSVLEGLHKLTTNRLIIFGAGNHELDFIACLTFCLLQLTSDLSIPTYPIHTRTTWHVNPSNVDIEHQDDRLNAHQARNLMAGAAVRVWEELYVCKKPAIEEVFKVTLVQGGGRGGIGGGGVPELGAVREQLSEAAQKLWLTYIDAERKTTYRVPWELHNQIQSRIHKVAGGLTRLASRTKVVRGSKEDIQRARIRVTKQQAAHWVINNVSMLKELCELRRTNRLNSAQHQQRYVHQEWLLTEAELLRERGLWGPLLPSVLDKWVLDTTEGPHRMRKKLMRNDQFYRHYPYRGDWTGTGDCTSKGQARYKYASSHHSRLNHFALQRRNNPAILPPSPTPIFPTNTSINQSEQSDDPNNTILQDSTTTLITNNNPATSATTEVEQQLATLASALPQLARLKSDPDDREDKEDAGTEEEVGSQGGAKPDNKMLLRLLQENEKISYMYRCARIQGLDTTEGLLLFGLEHCYIVDGFTLLKNRDIRDIEQALPSSGYEPILPNPGSPSRTSAGARRGGDIRLCSKFSYDDIREVHKRRYLLQPIALEVFSGDGRNHLLAFPRKIRNKVYQRFMATATGIADSARESVAGQKRTANVEQTAGLLSSLIGETSVTQRWVRGEISNFQYLMHLNTLAGRSYNDLMQYPVFPWILSDYDSEQLDLTDPSTFRDFTSPMGAQSPDRLAQFKKRYKEWDDPHGETPPYHYGIHYSSAMIVCSYLVRMEPFAQHFLRLQGGHFDLADRMFHSVREAWHSASRHNMADVKELIPEFFYLPEFLLNSNHFDLGAKQSGVVLGDIVLPPWAKQDPREFIRVHRMALECDYVSQNLHHWIDLIFGYKQQGQAAVDAVNVFHHLFYEGNVDIYNIDDPLKKNATIGFINNFGQIPKQLFKKPHPAKKIGTGNNRSSVIDSGASLVQAFSSPQPEKLFFHHLDNLRPSLQPIKEVKSPVGQILHLDSRSSSSSASILAVEQNKVLIPPAFNRYVAWGFADHSLRIGHYDSDKAVFVSENIVQNAGEIVACVCPNVKMIVTAGTSTVVTIWEYDPRHKHLSVKHSLYAHTEAVTCLASSAAYNVLVSGSRDCSAAMWDLSRGVFVRQLRGHAGPVAAVAVNNLTGDIATCAATWLHLWSINGDQLAKVNTCVGGADRMQQILCVSFSQTHEWDANNVIMTGSTDGVTRMWSIDYVQVPDESTVDSPPPISPLPLPSTIVTPPPSATSSHPPPPPKPTLLHQSRLLQKQLHVSNDSNTDSTTSLVKSGSESSLVSDDGNKRAASVEGETTAAAAAVVTGAELEVSTKEWRSEQENEKETCSDTEDGKAPVQAVRRRRSRVHTGLRKSEGGASAESNSLEVDDGSGMRTSKSDTSLTDSFVMVPDAKKKLPNALNALRQGFKWQRQLMFRSKLTMHTAYDRKDNAEPASITALAVSKDHRTVFVGDARGRVFSFSVTEAPGRSTADHWLKDEGSDRCAGCTVKFTLYERRHHCRNCGQLFCGKCSRFESEISRLRILRPVRVCQGCYKTLKN